MAKRKKRKETKKSPSYLVELFGIMLVLIAILGIGKYGPVGRVIASFSLFLVGSLYFFLLLFVLCFGVYIIINREKASLFSSKMIGVYLFVIGILVFLHQSYAIENVKTGDIIVTTLDNLMDAINRIMSSGVKPGVWNSSLANCGGGILGALFTTLFYKLFEADGTTIVVWVLLASGVMVFTGLSILDIVKNTKNKVKEMIPHTKEEKVSEKDKVKQDEMLKHHEEFKINDNNEELEKDKNKTVIKDLNELHANKEVIEVKEEKKEKEEHHEEISTKPYILPSLDLLDKPSRNKNKTDKAAIEANSRKLVQTLEDFGIHGRVVAVNVGPSVIQYELELSQGTKLSKLLGLNREIALSLAKKDVRIQAPIPGKNTVGIEMPNENAQVVTLRETLEGLKNENKIKSKLSVGLGKDIMGHVQACQINKTPHMLVAGATGSGKSVCINCIILSILMFTKPNEVKLILIDPKKVELGVYNGVPHLVTPVVTDPKKASQALQKAVSEMDHRYDLFEESKTRNIEGYNEYVDKYNQGKSDEDKIPKLPYWVVIVDELADLMLVAGKEVETSIARITQMARAAGIHLIIATQRPSTDVITGLIKANIPSRLAFTVSSQIDSRTILDMGGAEKLLGKGDMLYLPMGDIVPQRIQGAFVSDAEIERVVDYVVDQQKAQYDQNFFASFEDKDQEIKNNPVSNDQEEYDDPLYNDIVEFVVTSGKASASLLQRRFKLGYNRAARIIDLLEERGIIGPQNGSKPREVLIKLENKEEE